MAVNKMLICAVGMMLQFAVFFLEFFCDKEHHWLGSYCLFVQAPSQRALQDRPVFYVTALWRYALDPFIVL
jgi:hypothetical protein